jgi:cytochrome c peroxidase
VLDFYDNPGRGGRGRRGGTRNANVSRADLDPLFLDVRLGRGRQNDIEAFLDALSDENFDRTIPARVPSGLTVGGNIE